jgi:hypothetical protein
MAEVPAVGHPDPPKIGLHRTHQRPDVIAEGREVLFRAPLRFLEPSDLRMDSRNESGCLKLHPGLAVRQLGAPGPEGAIRWAGLRDGRPALPAGEAESECEPECGASHWALREGAARRNSRVSRVRCRRSRFPSSAVFTTRGVSRAQKPYRPKIRPSSPGECAASSARAISAMLPNRCAGSIVSAWWMTASTFAGKSGFTWRSFTG